MTIIDPKNNQYFSDSKIVQCLLESSIWFNPESIEGKLILEPTNGRGDLSNPLKKLGYNVLTNELDLQYPSDTHLNVFEPSFADIYEDVEVIFGNPPYQTYVDKLDKDGQPILKDNGEPARSRDKHAVHFIQRFMELPNVNSITLLLRLSMAEPTGNREHLLANQTFIGNEFFKLAEMVITPRISFTNDGNTDNMTTCFFTWVKGFKGTATVSWILKEDMK